MPNKNRIEEIDELAKTLVSRVVSDLARGYQLDDAARLIRSAILEAHAQGMRDQAMFQGVDSGGLN